MEHTLEFKNPKRFRVSMGLVGSRLLETDPVVTRHFSRL